MIAVFLIISAASWLGVAYVFEAVYRILKKDYQGSVQKHQWCWVWWTVLGTLAFATNGATGLVQMMIIFLVAAGHVYCCGNKEDVISPLEIVKAIPAALQNAGSRFNRSNRRMRQ